MLLVDGVVCLGVAEECRCNIGQFFTQFERNTMSRVLLWPSNVAAGTPQKLNRRDIENQKRWDKLRTRTAVSDKIQVLCVGRAGGTGFDAGMFEDDKTVFVVGEGKGLLMPKLDRQCLGLKLNETRKFLLKPGEEGHPQSERDRVPCHTSTLGRFKRKRWYNRTNKSRRPIKASYGLRAIKWNGHFGYE